MRFKVGDIVRVKKDHDYKIDYPSDMIVTSVKETMVYTVEYSDVSNSCGNWFESSLKLVRRPE